MASVSWSKNKKGELDKNLAHASRHDKKKNVDYDNPDIDPSRYGENYSIGGNWNRWRDERNRLLAQVRKLDELHPPKRVRQDRVTSISYVISLPKGLIGSGKEKEFFDMAYNELAEFSGGKENLTTGYVHADEIHDYYDPIKRKEVQSRQHLHVSGIPWTEEFGVNAKNFQTRSRMKELNDRINDKCLELFQTPFYDWDKSTQERRMNHEVGRDTEALKRESLRELENQKYDLVNELADKRMELIKVKDEIESKSVQLDELSDEVADKESRLWEYNQLERDNNKLRRRLNVFERVFSFFKETGLLGGILNLFDKYNRSELKKELKNELQPRRYEEFDR